MLNKAQHIYLEAQTHVYNVKSLEDLKTYEDIKAGYLLEVDKLYKRNPNSEVRNILDKVRILYEFADDEIVNRVQAGGVYNMRGGDRIGR